MTPQIRNGIALFAPQGFLDGNNAPSIITRDDINFIYKLKARAAIVSFKKVVFFNNNGVNFLVDTLLKIEKEKNLEIGFYDYKEELYEQLMTFFEGNPPVHFFQSQKVLDLFIDGKKDEKEKVLIYSENMDQRGIMLMRLREKAIKEAEVAKDKDQLKEKLQSDSFEIVVDQTYLATFSNKMPFYTRGNAVVYSIDGYIDGDIVDLFSYDYHVNSLSVGFKLFIFNCENVNSLNTHGVSFFNKLIVSSAEYNANICLAGLDLSKTPDALLDTLRDGGIFFEDSIESALENEELNVEDEGGIKRESKALSKKVIKELPVFIAATVETIELMTGVEAKKSGAGIGECSIEQDENIICASVGFFGDLKGIIYLFFKREIAKKACLLLLGEESKDIYEELDALSELLNIISGKVKVELSSKKDITIENTLPRTFKNMDTPIKAIGSQKGVLVKMLFDKEPFYFFLTR